MGKGWRETCDAGWKQEIGKRSDVCVAKGRREEEERIVAAVHKCMIAQTGE